MGPIERKGSENLAKSGATVGDQSNLGQPPSPAVWNQSRACLCGGASMVLKNPNTLLSQGLTPLGRPHNMGPMTPRRGSKPLFAPCSLRASPTQAFFNSLLGMGLASLSIVVGANVSAPMVAILFLSLGAGWLYLTVGAFWSSTVDLSKPHAGTLSGLMNTGGNLGGTLSPTLTPWLAEQFGWSWALGTAASVTFLGGLLWIRIRPGDGLR